jgi:hypothetical protein
MAQTYAIELKLTLLVAIYAVYKTLSDVGLIGLFPRSFYFVNQIAFLLGHYSLFKSYNVVTKNIQESSKISTKDKLSKKIEIKSTMRWILIRATSMGLLHAVCGNLAILPCTLLIGIISTKECEGWQTGLASASA